VLEVEFSEAGGISPDAPVEIEVPAEPEVENVRASIETVTCGDDSEAVLGIGELETFVEAGGMRPFEPVETKVEVDPEVVLWKPPDETMMLTFALGVGIALALLEMPEDGDTVPLDALPGGTNPLSPVEVKVAVLLPTVTLALPADMDTDAPPELEPGTGGMIPAEPVLTKVDVDPEVVEAKDPTETVTFGDAELLGSVEFDTAWMVCDAKLLDLVSIDGVMIPSAPSEVIVEVAPERVRLADPADVATLVEFAVYVRLVVLTPDSELPVSLEKLDIEARVEMVIAADPPDEAGGIAPLSPVETNVAVEPDEEDSELPMITTVVSFVVRVTGELETTSVLGDGSTMP
jgi:hypothetical protein